MNQHNQADFEREVLSAVFNPRHQDELQVVADQVARSVRSGESLDQVLTEAQHVLGLSFEETQKIASLLPEDIRKEAVAPPGHERQVKRLKEVPGIKNPWAASWAQHQKEKPGAHRKKAQEEPCDCPCPHFNGQHCPYCDPDKAREAEGTSKEVGLTATAGLKSTLRQLRQQLNSADHEDLDGISKLLSCIEGVEKELEKKEERLSEKRKQREDKQNGSSDEEPKEAEAQTKTAAPPPERRRAPDPLEEFAPEQPSAPPGPGRPTTGPETLIKDPGITEMLRNRAELTRLVQEVEAGVEEVRSKAEQLFGIPELASKVSAEEPRLMELLKSLEDKRVLVAHLGEQWSINLVEYTKATPAPRKMLTAILGAFRKHLEDARDKAQWALQVLGGVLSQPQYWSQRSPELQVGPTPKELAEKPHVQVSPAPPGGPPSGLRFSVEPESPGGARTSALKVQADALGEVAQALALLDDKLQDLLDLSDIYFGQLDEAGEPAPA